MKGDFKQSKMNTGEAHLVYVITELIKLEYEISNNDIGVISPYSG